MDRELREIILGGLGASWVVGGIQACGHFQAGLGCGGADKLQGFLITVQRLGFPVSADLAEQAMLDGIPFGGAGWIVRDGDAQSQAIAQLPLKF